MRHLFDCHYAPITFRIGFLQARFDNVVVWMDKWLSSLSPTWKVEATSGGFEEALRSFEPFNESPYLVSETTGDWTAILIGNCSGPQSAIPYLSRTHGVRGLFTSQVPNSYRADVNKGTWGATQFFTYSENSTGLLNDERTLQAVNNCGKWEFENEGEPYEFEDVGRYSRRSINERFTPEMLAGYCDSLGIKLDHDEFYGPRVACFRQDSELQPAALLETYESLKSSLIM